MTTKNRTRKICSHCGGPLHDCRVIHHQWTRPACED